MTEAKKPAPPALPSTHDDLSKWVEWVDAHYPYRSTTYSGPSELSRLVTYELRDIAASAARLWFAMQEKRRPPSSAKCAPREQLGFDGETWGR